MHTAVVDSIVSLVSSDDTSGIFKFERNEMSLNYTFYKLKMNQYKPNRYLIIFYHSNKLYLGCAYHRSWLHC